MTQDRFNTGGALDAIPDPVEIIANRLKSQVLSGYQISEPIGSGGMGHVFGARRVSGDFDRQAALKVVSSAFSSRDLIERFRTEVQILAKLNHPFIAQLYDAGETDDGAPYFIMELVNGTSIDLYCNGNDLAIDDRIRLLVRVCEAVRFAHSRLVVHRDLKPSNVLIDEDGKPKLLDFGIAKVIQPGNDGLTRTSRPMTPRYASPEQLLGKEITTGSDIYQLGILFLAVLTGETPSSGDSLEQAIQNAAAGRDQRLSASLQERLPSDLLSIILQCLHASPDDRYSDVNALIADLNRFLTGYPVDAARGETGYRIRKFLKRNAVLVGAGTLAAATILSGGIYHTLQVSKARDLAQTRAETSTRLLQAMSDLIANAYSELIETRGERATVSDDTQLQNEPLRFVVEQTQELIDDTTSDDPIIQAELLLLQGSINRQLSRFDLGEQQLSDSLRLHRETDNISGVLRTLSELASLHADNSDYQSSKALINDALALAVEHSVDDRLLARLNTAAAHAYTELGEYDDALVFAARAIELLENLPDGERLALAEAYVEIGGIYGRLEQDEQVRTWSQKAVELFLDIEGPNYRGLGRAYSGIAISYAYEGQYEEAKKYFELEIDVALSNFGENHIRTAAGFVNLGMTERRLGDYAQAITTMKRAEAILLALSPAGTQSLAALYVNLGNTYRDLGDLNLAADTYERGIALTDNSQNTARNRAFLLNNSGELMLDLGFSTAGERRLREALAAKIDVLGTNHMSTARTRLILVRSQLASGNARDAAELLDTAHTQYLDSYGPDHPKMAFLELTMAEYLKFKGEYDQSRDWLKKGYDHRLLTNSPDHIDVVGAALQFARLELLAGDLAQAAEWLSSTADGLSALIPTQIERIEAEILAFEIATATGADRSIEQQRLNTLKSVLAHYPNRVDWIQRLERT
ncbi:MAG: serine/threonine-protein kinase [Pseudomonadota bacterium]